MRGGSTRATLRGGALRWHGRAQPNRGRMTSAKWRALRLLAREPRQVARCHAIAPQTLRALARRGLVANTGQLWELTAAGSTALERYEPRPRHKLPVAR